MGDHVRADAHLLIDELRAVGVRHVAIATGDRASVADAVGAALGADRVYAEQSPGDKLEVVRLLRADPGFRPVVMRSEERRVGKECRL